MLAFLNVCIIIFFLFNLTDFVENVETLVSFFSVFYKKNISCAVPVD